MTSDAPPPMPPSSPPPPPPHDPPAPDPIPWEKEGVPFSTGLMDTIKLVVTSPVRGFQRVPVNAEFIRPLLYAVIIGTVSSLVAWVWQTAFGDVTSRLIPQGDADVDMNQLRFMEFTSSVVMVFLAPVIITVVLFVWAAIAHLFLMLAGGANQSYLATFKTMCYVQTTSLANLIPFCGGYIAGIWSIVLAIIGLREVHRTTTGKAVLAVLLPAVLFCVCIVVLSLAFGAALFGAMGGA